MDMSWIMVLLIWVLAPFAELGIIVGLCMSNSRYKRQIQELRRQERQQVMFCRPLEETQGLPVREQKAEEEHPSVREQEPAAMEHLPVREKEQERESEKPAADRISLRERSLSGSLGTVSLILGVIFIVLAGLIFATTTWHVLGDVSKTLLVLACAAVFFGASFMAEKIFSIHKTSNAFYVLGSAFLFLTVLAAAYFRLLGPEFILDGRNRWKVLWAGSLVMEVSFFCGLRRFSDKIYTQASLWGMSVSMFFLAKACSVKWNGFVSMMMVYGTVLIIVKEYLGRGDQKREGSLSGILAEGFGSFAPLHFWLFGGITVIRGFFAEGRMLVEGCVAGYSGFLDRFSLFTFSLPGLAAMAALVLGSFVLARNKKSSCNLWMLRLAAVEAVLYGAGWIADDFIWRMAVVNLSFLILGRIWDRNSLHWDICGCLALTVTLLNFYNDRNAGMEAMVLCLAAFAGYYFRFYLGVRQWPHLVAAACVLPFPLAAECRLALTFDQLGLGVGAALLVFGLLARCFYPIIDEDQEVQGGCRMDWFQILSGLTILYMIWAGDERWRFVYLLAAAVYSFQYTADESIKKPALSVSAVFLAAAFWQQPFLQWPDLVELEMNLLPAVCFTWILGVIWERNPWIRVMQTTSNMRASATCPEKKASWHMRNRQSMYITVCITRIHGYGLCRP